jgi:hypothetical protein
MCIRSRGWDLPSATTIMEEYFGQVEAAAPYVKGQELFVQRPNLCKTCEIARPGQVETLLDLAATTQFDRRKAFR